MMLPLCMLLVFVVGGCTMAAVKHSNASQPVKDVVLVLLILTAVGIGLVL